MGERFLQKLMQSSQRALECPIKIFFFDAYSSNYLTPGFIKLYSFKDNYTRFKLCLKIN